MRKILLVAPFLTAFALLGCSREERLMRTEPTDAGSHPAAAVDGLQPQPDVLSGWTSNKTPYGFIAFSADGAVQLTAERRQLNAPDDLHARDMLADEYRARCEREQAIGQLDPARSPACRVIDRAEATLGGRHFGLLGFEYAEESGGRAARAVTRSADSWIIITIASSDPSRTSFAEFQSILSSINLPRLEELVGG